MNVVKILSTATLLSQLALVAVVCMAIISLIKGKKEKFIAKVRPLLLPFAFTVSLIATLGSLFYSEVLGFEPCKLCWFQRILMYPQSVLYLVAYLSKKKDVFFYTLPLSVIGVVIASYHYLLQRGMSPLTPCGTVGYSVSCSTTFVMEYGYITIPMQSLTAFMILTALGVAAIIKVKAK